MIKGRKSIFFQLTMAFLLLGLLPLLIAGVVLYGQFGRNLERVMLKDMTRVVDYTCNNVEEMKEECDRLTKLMYDIPLEDGRWLFELLKDKGESGNGKKQKLNGLLKEILERDSKIASVYFVEESGQMYYATSNTQKVLNEAALREKIEDMGLAGMGLSMGATHVDDYFPQSKNQVITFSRPYRDMSGIETLDHVLGRLYVDIKLTKLSAVLEEMDQEKQGVFRLMADSGVCIYSTRKEEIGKYLGADKDLAVMWGEGGAGQSILTAKDYLVYEEIPGCSWKAVLETPRRELLRNLYQTRRAVLWFIGGSFIVLIMLYRYFLGRFRRPVEELKDGMVAIQQGKLSTRVCVEREDELGLLGEGLNHMAQELEEYIHRVYVAEIRQREAELDALKSQIKPHYLYNTLDVIRMMALDHSDNQTAQMVESLSRQLKYLIGYNSDRVPLCREIDNIQEYFVIMRARYENRISLELDIAREVEECQIIKLSLQPIVENAVRHGLRQKGGGTLRIEAVKAGNGLEITVMDDGAGMDEATLTKLRESLEQESMGELKEDGWHHVGLKNAYERIKKNFGPDYGLEIFSDKDVGTVVIYHLPFIKGSSEKIKEQSF